MTVDILIIGQGISGTFLHWFLTRSGFRCCIVDDNRENTASRIAAGIINPVTGRRLVKTWMIDQLLPFAMTAYKDLGEQLGCEVVQQKEIINFFATPQMREAFILRYQDSDNYLELPVDENIFNDCFNHDFGFGKISRSYLVMVDTLITTYRRKLLAEDALVEEVFSFAHLEKSGGRWQYGGVCANLIIFCDGINAVRNPYFSMLPFAPNKGEVIYVSINEKLPEFIFKNGMNLVQLEENLYWVGSSYEWSFADDLPSALFLEKTRWFLQRWLKIPFQIIDHRASIRPATLERRPFAGFHPLDPTVGILNGMGTKGCTLAPWFANELTNHIKLKTGLNPDADILRFRNILSKS